MTVCSLLSLRTGMAATASNAAFIGADSFFEFLAFFGMGLGFLALDLVGISVLLSTP
jgi:hypothetical protein